jgi:hypothetical protein
MSYTSLFVLKNPLPIFPALELESMACSVSFFKLFVSLSREVLMIEPI